MKRISYKQENLKTVLRHFAGGQNAGASRVSDGVASILADIRDQGDTGIMEHVAAIDKVHLIPDSFRVKEAELAQAAASLDAGTRSAIEEAISSVRAFHEMGMPTSWEHANGHGATVGEIFYPIDRVGLYIPGGKAPLVSTVVMTAVPAKLAGVPSIAACTPPGPEGRVNTGLLAAFHMCGVSEVYRIGGPMAIGAMAYGTATIPSVCKIFGPGNAYVAEAKRQVFGTVGIDILAGPSEVLILADSTANPAWVAADLIAQAEHGSSFERVTLVTLDPTLPGRVEECIRQQLPHRSHKSVIELVLKDGFLVVDCNYFEQMCDVANFMAPEHMEVHLSDELAPRVSHNVHTAGAIFVGHYTPTVLGDFAAGPNHTLPTVRTGRFYSGLQITDFMRRSSVVHYDRDALEKAAHIVRTFAKLESLDGHGECLDIRLRDK